MLLDFWAVWCGPCIATFPHLRSWHEEHKDLVIIGVTNYYGYAWNEKSQRAERGEEKVEPQTEQEMLVQFAKKYELKHPFAIQNQEGEASRALSKHYAVQGIPQTVLIDRAGKVRMIRVGSGEESAHDTEEMIAKLLAE